MRCGVTDLLRVHRALDAAVLVGGEEVACDHSQSGHQLRIHECEWISLRACCGFGPPLAPRIRAAMLTRASRLSPGHGAKLLLAQVVRPLLLLQSDRQLEEEEGRVSQP